MQVKEMKKLHNPIVRIQWFGKDEPLDRLTFSKKIFPGFDRNTTLIWEGTKRVNSHHHKQQPTEVLLSYFCKPTAKTAYGNCMNLAPLVHF